MVKNLNTGPLEDWLVEHVTFILEYRGLRGKPESLFQTSEGLLCKGGKKTVDDFCSDSY